MWLNAIEMYTLYNSGSGLYTHRRKASVRKLRLDDAEPLTYVREHSGEKFRWAPECVTER
jgi:hypothetical protein